MLLIGRVFPLNVVIKYVHVDVCAINNAKLEYINSITTSIETSLQCDLGIPIHINK